MDNKTLILQLTEKKVKEVIAKVVGRSRQTFSTLSQDEMTQTCELLGFKMSPYLSVEAHMVSCGGFETQGNGPFDVLKFIDWLKKRQVRILPVKPSNQKNPFLKISTSMTNRYETIRISQE